MVKSLQGFKKSVDPRMQYPFRVNHPIIESRAVGDVGIEVECEGRRLARAIPAHKNGQWDATADGSLRGEAMEYVLAKPINIKHMPDVVNHLYYELGRQGSVLNDSNRTSVHIHINMDKRKVNEVASIIAIYGVLEDVLVNYCGPHRVGNLFALRLSDSEWAIEQIVTALQRGTFRSFENNVRYLAMNLSSINKFGSLEFRSMRGCTEPTTVIKWTQMLWDLKEKAIKDYNNPEDIAMRFSGLGALGFLRSIVGPAMAQELDEYHRDIGENLEELIWAGLRRMQPVIYALPWYKLMEHINVVAIPDPFMKKKVKKVRGIDMEALAFDELRRMAAERAAPIPVREWDPVVGQEEI